MKTATLNHPIMDFTFATTDNPKTSFVDFKGEQLVLYFYPKDNTPGCTIEAKDFRDLYEEFKAANANILGISRDSLKSHHNFKESCELPFPLISDEKEVLCQYFNVIKEKNMYGKKVLGIERSTFLINAKGILQQEWRNVKVPGHVQTVLDTIRSS